jgi:hypothetical protein
MAVRADLNNIFGALNITKWADMSNNRNEAEISARVTYAINLAVEDVKARLRLLPYDIDVAIELPLVQHHVVLRAGDILYSPRAVNDEDPEKDLMKVHRKNFIDFFKQLSAGQLDLGITRTCRPYPKVEEDVISESFNTSY